MVSAFTDRFDGAQFSQAIKSPCVVVTTTNLTLSGEQTVNSIAVTEGDRVLVKDQDDTTENGIYVTETGEWVRAPDFDGARDVLDGTLVVVSKATGTDFFYQVDATNPIVIGTSAIAFILASYPNVDIPITQAEIDYGLTTADINTSYDLDDARRYGAAMNGDDASPTNDTAAFDTAFGVSNLTIKLYGTYAVADLDIQDSSIDGQGIGKFVAASGATSVLVVNAYTGDSWHYRRIENLEIDATGDAIRTVDAITLDGDVEHLAAGLIVDTCYIHNANGGIYKPYGSIGDEILTCTVKNCNYGYFGKDSAAPPQIQHPGANRIQGGMWSGHKKVAIYISSATQNAGQTIIDGPVIASNVGWAIYIDGYNLTPTSSELRSPWFESNNSGSADIDLGFGNGSETPRDVFFRDVDHFIITGCHVTDTGMEFVNSMATLNGCFFNILSVLVQDSESVVRCINANLDGIQRVADVVIESITQQRRNSLSGTNMAAQILPRTHIVKKLPGTGVGVYSDTMDHSNVNFSGSSGTRTAGGGNCGLYPYHQRLTTSVSTLYIGALAAVVKNKWYVYTFDMMVEAAEALDFVSFDGSGAGQDLAVGFQQILLNNITAGDWVTLGGVAEYTDTTGNVRFRMKTTGDDNPALGIGPVQIIQFDTQKEATQYFNSGAFYQGTVYEASGLATLSGGAKAIDFTDEGFVDMPEDAYDIQLTSNSPTNPSYSANLKTGFTIDGGTTDVVKWSVKLQDL